MNKNLTTPEKQALIKRYRSGESAAGICMQSGIARSTFYSWIKRDEQARIDPCHPTSATEVKTLSNRVNRLKQIIEVLKKADCTVAAPTQDRLNALEKLHGQYSVRVLCDAMEVPRGTYYNHILRNKRENKSYQARRDWLSENIKQVYDESNQIYGAKKVRAVLFERGIVTSDRMVAELMSIMNISSIRSDAKKNYKRFYAEKKKDGLQMSFKTNAPDTVWVGDTTYFRLMGKTYYICAILDLYSRKVVAYSASIKHSTQLVTRAFKAAYSERKPPDGLTFHSDRGTQYTSHAFEKLLRGCRVTQSFSPTGRPCNNAVMESFFASLKREELYRTNYHSVQEFTERLGWYINFYNTERPHSTLGLKTPSHYESLYYGRIENLA